MSWNHRYRNFCKEAGKHVFVCFTGFKTTKALWSFCLLKDFKEGSFSIWCKSRNFKQKFGQFSLKLSKRILADVQLAKGRGRGGVDLSYPLLKIEISALIWKKMPGLCPLWAKCLILNAVFRKTWRQNTKIFACRVFFSVL